ncbi:unnamed protein product [Linum trigynum]|uniref:RNase H type-1 domain-containing protein n=1 Tax=Linum trigynum TaxID=586398 RepID=A0AAV2CTA0_9ROSI
MQVPLKEITVVPIPEDEVHKPVAAYISEIGQWRVDLLQQWLPSYAMDKVTAIATDIISAEEDRLCWQPTSTGDFTAKSAYQIAFPAPQPTYQKVWKAVWNLQVPERVRHFIWLVLLHRINTNKRRFDRHIAPDPFCPNCNNVPETKLHILRDCPTSLFFWTREVPANSLVDFLSADLDHWVSTNILNTEARVPWASSFSIALWTIWKNRNEGAFSGGNKLLSPPSLRHAIHLKVHIWHSAWMAPSPLLLRGSFKSNRVVTDIGWVAPPRGWCKLNVDGASQGNPGKAAAGGVFRDDQRRWLGGFCYSIGDCSAACAELWAIKQGLEMAWRRDLRLLIVESDSRLAIDLIQHRVDHVHPLASLLRSIRRLVAQDWLVNIVHTYREGNRVADWLSKHGLVYPHGMYELVDPPAPLRPILQDDERGVVLPRSVVQTPQTHL